MSTAAEEDSAADSAEEKTLPAVVVVGVKTHEGETGKSVVTKSDLETIPLSDGDATEALKTVPGVQFPEEDRLSDKGGEILPAKISISGGRIFENNFRIDGVGNNSYLDPAADEPNDIDSVPGHPQAVFLRSRLAESITVYRSNVSARYGNFVGGVVDMKTRDPRPEFGGAVFYRGTRDEWTAFHLADGATDDFESSTSASQQPNFLKQNGGLELNIPLTENSGLLAAYEILHSDITLNHFGTPKDEQRRLENLFLKHVVDFSSETSLKTTLLLSPSESNHFIESTRESDFTIESGGQTVASSLTRFYRWGTVEASGSYAYSENSRSAPATWWNWAITPSKPWGGDAGTSGSRQGGFGDLESTQRAWEGHLDITGEPLTAGGTEHILKTGLEFQHLRGTMDREESLVQYSGGTESQDVICDNDPIACVDGEQYLSKRLIYDAGSAKKTVRAIGLYGENTIAWRRIEIRPGMRYSYSDFYEEHNVAPRISASLDLFGDGNSVFLAGWNRYFDSPMLSLALRQSIAPLRIEQRGLQDDNRPGPWNLLFQTNTRSRPSELETPYSDEMTFGFDQALFGGQAYLEYIRREGHDLLAREKTDTQADGYKYYEMNNNGRSHHDAYHAAWRRNWDRHFLDINGTYQDTRTNAEDYDVKLEEEALQEKIFYNGDILFKDELPRENYNRDWTANLLYVAQLPARLEFSNFTRYRSGYYDLRDSGEETTLPDGEVVPVYEKFKQPSSWIFDWKLAWHRPIAASGDLTLNLEVLNVFNEKTAVGSKENEFEMGRQIWAGAEYLF
ncbi:MAG: TonB-dependent receptor plug domain-containing protein [Desulfuromonadales bacterium]